MAGVLTPAPAELTAKCLPPQELPDRDLTQAEVEKLWGKDRMNLVICGRKHEKVVDYYKKRDKVIMGKDLK